MEKQKTISPLPEGITKATYAFVAELLWGNVFTNDEDVKTSIDSELWKTMSPIILSRYPKLQKSFNEEYEKRRIWYMGESKKYPYLSHSEWDLVNVPKEHHWYKIELTKTYYIRKAISYRRNRMRHMRKKRLS